MVIEQVFLVLLFNPLNLCYRSSRFFFLRVWQHVICAPFYKVLILPISLDSMHQMTHLSTQKLYLIYEEWMVLQVGLADFFLADQLTSQVCNMSELQETFTQLTWSLLKRHAATVVYWWDRGKEGIVLGRILQDQYSWADRSQPWEI